MIMRIALVTMLAACGKADAQATAKAEKREARCRAWHERLDACLAGDDAPVDEDRFLEQCQRDLDHDPLGNHTATIACARHASCVDFTACVRRVEAEFLADGIGYSLEIEKLDRPFATCVYGVKIADNEAFHDACKRLMTHVAQEPATGTSDNFDTMAKACTSDDYTRVVKLLPEAARACAAIGMAMLAPAVAKATELRDRGQADSGVCTALAEAGRLVEPTRPGAAATAQRLCDEMSAAAVASEARTSRLASGSTKAPVACVYATEVLARLGTPWAHDELDRVLAKCYLDHHVVGADGCPPGIAGLVRADRTWSLSARHPKLAAALAKLPPSCISPK